MGLTLIGSRSNQETPPMAGSTPPLSLKATVVFVSSFMSEPEKVGT